MNSPLDAEAFPGPDFENSEVDQSRLTSGRLLTRSCTTSWSDWNHGDLLLTSDAIVRIRLAEPTREGRQLRNTVGATPQHRALPAPADALTLIASDPTNKYILLAAVATARLHRGLLNDRLAVGMQDRSQHKLLWLHADPAYAILADRLPSLLTTRFALD